VLDDVFDRVAELGAFLVGTGYVFAPIYLLASLAFGAGLWLARRPGESLPAFLFPREVYRRKSVELDVRLTCLNTVFLGLGGLSFAVLGPLVAAGLASALGGPSAAIPTPLGSGIALALVLFLIDDFCRFALHFVHHKLPALWPFHEVHHSAEVLTPLTFFRAHPLYFFVQRMLISACSGLLQALVAVAAFGRIDAWVFFAAALPWTAYMLAGIHLRHSHIPVRYPRWAEGILVSPYLHQLHHSLDERHRDVNFGEVLSIWDRLFGTLHRPAATDPLAFGLSDGQGGQLQPYPDLAAALFAPFGKSFRALARLVEPGRSRAEPG
jgi:sterol desaturase/sphingolipid hydroxylase (fatty acid hydroxylase superfamily)